MKLNSHQLRRSRIGEASEKQKKLKRHPLVLVLDNVIDTYNIGSFFRLADALAAEKICLCGPVVTPPNIKIHRSSIGTWKWIKWEHFDSTPDCLRKLKKDGYYLMAVEQHPDSVSYLETDYPFPLAIIAGSESDGVGESALKLCDRIIEIPVYGINVSLNVLIAAALVGYRALESKK